VREQPSKLRGERANVEKEKNVPQDPYLEQGLLLVGDLIQNRDQGAGSFEHI
jgi:hypothetical protein